MVAGTRIGNYNIWNLDVDEIIAIKRDKKM